MLTKSKQVGNDVQLNIYQRWNVQEIGNKVETIDGQQMVTSMWCRVHSKYSAKICALKDPRSGEIGHISLCSRHTSFICTEFILRL